jgi:ABC-type uncharacterized transport system substrate-binding protein
MGKRSVMLALGAAILLTGTLQVWASGVFIVSRKGIDTYDDAKAGFIQMAYSLQLPEFNPKAVDLDGSAADDAAITALKAQSPSLVFTVGSYAAKKVRQALPDTWIIYAMVYYPEAEGFTNDAKMVGVASLGPTKALASVLKALTKIKSLVVVHSQAIDSAMPDLLTQLKSDGLDAESKSVADASGLKAAFDAVKDQYRAVLILPDPITTNQDALRFMVSQCVASGLIPVSLSETMVAGGAMCASFYPPDAVGNQAARVAADILNAGKVPNERLVAPSESATALNKGTATALGIQIPKKFRAEVTYE